jgi:hypothetical protein
MCTAGLICRVTRGIRGVARRKLKSFEDYKRFFGGEVMEVLKGFRGGAFEED